MRLKGQPAPATSQPPEMPLRGLMTGTAGAEQPRGDPQSFPPPGASVRVALKLFLISTELNQDGTHGDSQHGGHSPASPKEANCPCDWPVGGTQGSPPCCPKKVNSANTLRITGALGGRWVLKQASGETAAQLAREVILGGHLLGILIWEDNFQTVPSMGHHPPRTVSRGRCSGAPSRRHSGGDTLGVGILKLRRSRRKGLGGDAGGGVTREWSE